MMTMFEAYPTLCDPSARVSISQMSTKRLSRVPNALRARIVFTYNQSVTDTQGDPQLHFGNLLLVACAVPGA